MERGANPEIEKHIKEELDQTWADVETEAEASKPLNPEDFEAAEAVVVRDESDLEDVERTSEAVEMPAELKEVGEELGEAMAEKQEEASSAAAEVEEALKKAEESPDKPAPEEGTWE